MKYVKIFSSTGGKGKSLHPKKVNCQCDDCGTLFYRKIRLPVKCPVCHGNVRWIEEHKLC